MSATIATRAESGLRPTFPRLVRSEWIKLRSLRSSVWTAVLTVGIMGAFAGLFAWALTSFPDEAPTSAGVLVVGYPIAQLAIAVLGVLVVTGEYATGAVRSTLAAEPRRLRVVASKGLVLAAVSFVVATVSVGLSALIAIPVLQAGGAEVLFGADDIRALVGTVLYLTVSSLFAFGIGLLVKNSAAAITAVVGVLFILPIIVQIIAVTTRIEWIMDAYSYLPAPAGSAVAGSGTVSMSDLDPWLGFAIFCGYTVVALVAGAVAFSRRDD
ncbi:ABC transporter permease subunit [Protaetiibacter sp. SSC-01]|uniref:ABC transporter permease subunit n=1 Tax=Protaetiibacter sp. SSC-01 TaxID=2759943 RepID=UPI0016575B7C|nr:ABC transporter permease subunit [Protaetiibacter sp. SSC-01]QNO37749.1 ABC transporter permease subunit [Protaetiibacter sp. SSC-01]